ncbi:MAG: hypothetical protein ACK5IQ_06565 [Bacteroidales bacterium]
MRNRITISVAFVLVMLFEVSVSSQSLPDIPLSKLKMALPYADEVKSADAKRYRYEIDESAWKAFGEKVPEEYEGEFKYYITGAASHGGNMLYIIERYYTEETIHWLVMVDKSNKILSAITTAYNNSEGFYSKKSLITEKEVVVNIFNLYNQNSDNKEQYDIAPNTFKRTR